MTNNDDNNDGKPESLLKRLEKIAKDDIVGTHDGKPESFSDMLDRKTKEMDTSQGATQGNWAKIAAGTLVSQGRIIQNLDLSNELISLKAEIIRSLEESNGDTKKTKERSDQLDHLIIGLLDNLNTSGRANAQHGLSFVFDEIAEENKDDKHITRLVHKAKECLQKVVEDGKGSFADRTQAPKGNGWEIK